LGAEDGELLRARPYAMVVGPTRSARVGGEESLLKGEGRDGNVIFQEWLGKRRMVVGRQRARRLQWQVFRVTVAIPGGIVESINGIKAFAVMKSGPNTLDKRS